MCVYSEVPRRVRKIPQPVIALTFQKCELSIQRENHRAVLESTCNRLVNLFRFDKALEIF